MEPEISAYLLRLRRTHPFLATLSLHMRYELTDTISSFETNGRITWVNRALLQKQTADERVGTLLHVTLHGALLHTVRQGNRIASVWNIAADIVVNNIIAQGPFRPPRGTPVEPRYADQSVEQVYAQLMQAAEKVLQATRHGEFAGASHDAPTSMASPRAQSPTVPRPTPTALPSFTPAALNAGEDADAGRQQPRSPGAQRSAAPARAAAPTHEAAAPRDNAAARAMMAHALSVMHPTINDLRQDAAQHPNAAAEFESVRSHWQHALTRAAAVDRFGLKFQGEQPLGLKREIQQVLRPRLDWRTLLWRFMSRTPCDFSGFDRRFIHQGLYLEELEGESLTAHIAVDTSGSISNHELDQFCSEVDAITRCYTFVDAKLYFVDAEVHGPYPLQHGQRIREAIGGGGTDFRDLFERISVDVTPYANDLCIYLTDGLGTFPARPPSIPVLWVVSGTEVEFPFGDVAYLDSESKQQWT